MNNWKAEFNKLFTYKEDKPDRPIPEVCNGLKWQALQDFISQVEQQAKEEGRKEGLEQVKAMFPEIIHYPDMTAPLYDIPYKAGQRNLVIRMTEAIQQELNKLNK